MSGVLSGEKLKKLRLEKGLSVQELAEKLDIPVGCLKDVEQGKRKLSKQLVKKLCVIMELPEDYFDSEEDSDTLEEVVDQISNLTGAVGRKIRKLRERKGLTLVDFGKQAGISYTHISEIERGNTCPSLKTISKLAAVLGVPVTDFFTEEQQEVLSEEVCPPNQPQKEENEPVDLNDIQEELSVEEMELFRGLVDLIKRYKTKGMLVDDPVVKNIVDLLSEMNTEEKQNVLDYALFLKSKYSRNN